VRFRASFAAIAWIALASAAPSFAFADEPTIEDRRAAARAFESGEKAFAAGDYLRAAELFEEANQKAPHYANVWNAARAYQKLGENARAATLYARYLRIAPADAPDRDGATAALRELSPKLGRLDVYAPEAKDVRVDGKALDDATVFVPPGSHLVTATAENKAISRTVSVEAGASASVALPDAPAPLPPTATPMASAPPSPLPKPPPSNEPPTPPPSRGWSPAVVAASGSLTAVALGFTIASGVDTSNGRDAFNQEKTRTTGEIDDGLAKEHRTNILVGVTVGVGVLTGAAAIWLVDWHRGSNRAKIGVTPGGARVAGSF
jgi:hypothetical protein